jgi:hypothetical protein
MLRFTSSKVSPSAAPLHSRLASAPDFAMLGQYSAMFCSSSLFAANGELGKTMPPSVRTLAILAFYRVNLSDIAQEKPID